MPFDHALARRALLVAAWLALLTSAPFWANARAATPSKTTGLRSSCRDRAGLGPHCAQRARARRAPGRPGRRTAQSHLWAPQATPFSPTSVWNRRLSASAPVAARSSTYVSDLLAQISQAGLWMNTYAYSTPVFTVPANQRTVKVRLNSLANPMAVALQRSWLAVPIPPHAKAASGTDENMVVYQPSTNRMWEFWEMAKHANRWHAAWGGTIDNVSSNPGYYTDPAGWGAAATSLPLLGGLIRPSELAAGHIDHALSIGIPDAQAEYFAWPAQRTDGWIYHRSEIPEGQRFRLDPHLDLNRYPMSPLVRMIAVAAQRYGIIVRDQAGAVTFYGEDTSAEGRPDPYYGPRGYFENQYVSNLLKAFPWSHLKALRNTLSCCWAR